jgi:hypothetical protein
MSMNLSHGFPAAVGLRDFFDLQLHFAETLASRAASPLVQTLTYHTNLHRRFAYGNVARQAPAPEFLALAEHLAALPDHAARLDAIVEAFAVRPVLGAPTGAAEFGCFRCEPPDERGHARLHFSNRDTSEDRSPLHSSKIERRRAELRALVAWLAQQYPQTQAIDGGSWLYNTRSYRRLFPAEFANSRKPIVGQRMIHGGSTWGQFLDFRGAVKPSLREAFLADLASSRFDPASPWSIFPLPVLKTSAPFDFFRREYGC